MCCCCSSRIRLYKGQSGAASPRVCWFATLTAAWRVYPCRMQLSIMAIRSSRRPSPVLIKASISVSFCVLLLVVVLSSRLSPSSLFVSRYSSSCFGDTLGTCGSTLRLSFVIFRPSGDESSPFLSFFPLLPRFCAASLLALSQDLLSEITSSIKSIASRPETRNPLASRRRAIAFLSWSRERPRTGPIDLAIFSSLASIIRTASFQLDKLSGFQCRTLPMWLFLAN